MVLAWHVVMFVEEERVEVFPKCWVINNDLGYWPNIKRPGAIGPLIKGCSLPDKSWNVEKIRIIGKNKIYDDYSQASHAASKACYKTDIDESTECDENIQTCNSSKGRRIIQNKRYFNSEEESSDSEVGSCASSLRSIPSKPVRGKDNSKTEKRMNKEFKIIEAPVEDSPFRKEYEDSILKMTSHKIISSQQNTDQALSQEPINGGANGKCHEHDELLKKLCSRVSYLTLLTKGIAEDISHIKLQMETNITVPTHPSAAASNEEVYNFPFETAESLEEFEKTLENRENYLKFVNFVSRIGGDSPYEFIKRVMGRLVTNEVAAKYSFTGHKGKRPIGQFLIAKALKDASRNVKSLIHCTENDIEKKLKDWLRHAPARAHKKQEDPPNRPEEDIEEYNK